MMNMFTRAGIDEARSFGYSSTARRYLLREVDVIKYGERWTETQAGNLFVRLDEGRRGRARYRVLSDSVFCRSAIFCRHMRLSHLLLYERLRTHCPT